VVAPGSSNDERDDGIPMPELRVHHDLGSCGARLLDLAGQRAEIIAG